ncbi:uncharacterized protein G2W53_032396 [Senna tora]|uniref:Uncharacterized protein n=1 Tax=Senna tora TaxID=362788 RepID=A0A834SWA6_9FABA|nr:uncharacterized protein G2W53_032396 [Senna tora]
MESLNQEANHEAKERRSEHRITESVNHCRRPQP